MSGYRTDIADTILREIEKTGFGKVETRNAFQRIVSFTVRSPQGVRERTLRLVFEADGFNVDLYPGEDVIVRHANGAPVSFSAIVADHGIPYDDGPRFHRVVEMVRTSLIDAVRERSMPALDEVEAALVEIGTVGIERPGQALGALSAAVHLFLHQRPELAAAFKATLDEAYEASQAGPTPPRP